jgi:Tfp pilus assembly protein PilP
MNEIDDDEISLNEIINNIDYEWYADEVIKLTAFSAPPPPTLFT